MWHYTHTSRLLAAGLISFGLALSTGCGAPDESGLDVEEAEVDLAEAERVTRTDTDGDGSPLWKDCNDKDAAVYPGAPERCDGKDNDCDGFVDLNAVDAGTWFPDGDRDTWGASSSVRSCMPPVGYTTRGGDCDDSRADVHPSASPVCDGSDTDCDGSNQDELFFCFNVDEPGEDPSSFDPGEGDGVDDPSHFAP